MIDWAAIEAWPLAAAIRRSIWAYPVLEALHICAFASLVGSLLMLELRVFGAQPAIPAGALGRLALRVAAVSFLAAATAGVLLFLPSAAENAANPAFQSKLALILMAGLNAVVFHVRHGLRRQDGVAQFQAGISLALWFAVIVAGRMIAYV